jgi:UDP-N-acetyl-D-glucosamine dehydrogenase
MTCTPLEQIPEFDCVVIVTDHSQYDYADIVKKAKLVVDTRNATEGIDAAHIVRC